MPAVDRAMRIMALLESSPQCPFSISDIARTLGIPQSTAFNICGALAEGADAAPLPRRLPARPPAGAAGQREIAEARETHYAHDEEETIAGLSCIARALPSTHADGGFVAVSISASVESLTPARKLAIRASLDGIVAELGNRN